MSPKPHLILVVDIEDVVLLDFGLQLHATDTTHAQIVSEEINIMALVAATKVAYTTGREGGMGGREGGREGGEEREGWQEGEREGEREGGGREGGREGENFHKNEPQPRIYVLGSTL